MTLEHLNKCSSNHVAVRVWSFVSEISIIPKTFAKLKAVGHTAQSVIKDPSPAPEDVVGLHPNTSQNPTRITAMPRYEWGLLYLDIGTSEHQWSAMD